MNTNQNHKQMASADYPTWFSAIAGASLVGGSIGGIIGSIVGAVSGASFGYYALSKPVKKDAHSTKAH